MNVLPRMNPPARLAGIVFARGAAIDAMIADICAELGAAGLGIAGVVQVDRGDGRPGISNLRLSGIRSGWEIPILQDRGPEARGCRLDPRAIADVAGLMREEIADDPDLVVINRFGRAETEGHGLRAVLEQVALSGTPLLIGVREDYADAWAEFHGGLGTQLPPARDAVIEWCRKACAKEPAALLKA